MQLLDDDAEEVFVELLVPQGKLRALLRRARRGVEAREQPRELEPAVEGVVGGGHSRLVGGGVWGAVGRNCVVSGVGTTRAPRDRGEG